PVSIDGQPCFLEVDEHIEVVRNRALDAALQSKTPAVEDDEVGDGAVMIAKNDRVDRARADIRSPSAPAWDVVDAREKDGTEPNGAESAQGGDGAFAGHRRFRRDTTHHLQGD